MAITEFSQAGRRAFLLEIAGLGIRYWGGARPPVGIILGTLAAYQDVEAIVGVSDYSARMDLSGGVAEFDPVVVTMSSNQFDGRAPSGDPGVVFGRLGINSANAATFLATSIQQDDALAGGIELMASPFTAPDLVYIEQEAFYFTGVSGNTLTGVTRGAAGTHQQEHLIDNNTGSAPVVTDTVVFWRGRRATLSMAPV